MAVVIRIERKVSELLIENVQKALKIGRRAALAHIKEAYSDALSIGREGKVMVAVDGSLQWREEEHRLDPDEVRVSA